MTNFHSPGRSMTYTAPTGGVTTGVPVLIGSLLVVPATTVAQTLPFVGGVEGVFTLSRVDDEEWGEGDKLYWDDNAGKVTTDDASAANPLVGVAAEAIAASPAVATGLVRLDGVAR